MQVTLQIALISLLCVASGCKRTRPTKLVSHKEQSRLQEAKLRDVSLPVGVAAYELMPLDTQREAGENMVTYETEFSAAMLRDFYSVDMERLGWKEVQPFVATDESCLVYETPRKIAVISIRESAGDNRSVMIFVGPRRI